MWVQPLGWEDSLEEEMAIHSRILAWRIPWTEEPGRQHSTGLHSQTPLWKTLFCKQQINFYICAFKLSCFQLCPTRVGYRALLQGIFLTQGSNLRLLCLLPWWVGSLPLVPPGKPDLACTHALFRTYERKGINTNPWRDVWETLL